jgi:hypothetical protein
MFLLLIISKLILMKNFKSILFATLTVAIVSCDSNEITQEGTDLIASNSEFITRKD